MRVKAYTVFTDSHACLKDKFLETFKWEDGLDLSVRYLPQVFIDGEANTEWKSKQFAQTVRNKMILFNDILKELQDGDLFIYLDCDIVFRLPIKDIMISELEDYDIAFQKDGEKIYCTGCFICKISPKIREFFDKMWKDYDKFNDDQDCINHGLRNDYKDMIKSKFLSNKFLNFGILCSKQFRTEKDFDGLCVSNETVLFHSNYTVGIPNKLRLAQWFIDYKFLPPVTKKLSVLICTMTGRETVFKRLMECLNKQIDDRVEILIEKDDGKMVVGHKRNVLLDRASGEYCCFIDDDDLVSENYIQSILDGIEKGNDCCSLHGIMTKDGLNPVDFYHSIKYSSWGDSKDENGKFFYYRCPNHLNVIKTSICKQVRYHDKLDREEDEDFSIRVSKHLKTESVLADDVIYYYLCVTKHIPVKKEAVQFEQVKKQRQPILATWRQ